MSTAPSEARRRSPERTICATLTALASLTDRFADERRVARQKADATPAVTAGAGACKHLLRRADPHVACMSLGASEAGVALGAGTSGVRIAGTLRR